jgi:hypothetical protein
LAIEAVQASVIQRFSQIAVRLLCNNCYSVFSYFAEVRCRITRQKLIGTKYRRFAPFSYSAREHTSCIVVAGQFASQLKS